MNENFYIMTAALVAGAVATDFIRFNSDPGKWAWRAFLSAVIRSVVTALVLAVAQNVPDQITPVYLVSTFLSGMGAEGGEAWLQGKAAPLTKSIAKTLTGTGSGATGTGPGNQ